jgi:hypothetical protein
VIDNQRLVLILPIAAYASKRAVPTIHSSSPHEWICIMNTLLINIFCSLIVFSAAYRWILRPIMPKLQPSTILIPILLLHSLRHLGLMFLTTGVTSSAMPQQFAAPAAAGDFLSATLAFTAAALIHRKSTWAVPATWLFSIVGIADFASAVVLSRLYNAADFMGGAYWIPSFWVPLLMVGHFVIIKVMLQIKREGVRIVH